ncbi:MAG: multicopper oxidase domain-containing protein [Chloroflexota bacterium]|nr:multicopper oxidase domain-containing protein [Chloroflexota bacterium]
MASFRFPVDSEMPNIDELRVRHANRRTFLRGAAGLGLAAGAVGLARSNGEAQDHTHGAGTPEAADPDGGYVGSDSTTRGDTGDSTPVPGQEIRPFTPYQPFLPKVEPGPKHISISCVDQTVYIAKDTPYAGWTFDGTIPGPVLRAVEGDTITTTIRNDAPLTHSLDFHSARVNPERGYRNLAPGEEFQWSFHAKYPGAYMYHCGTAPVLMHIAAGMYGAMIVDPKEGWSPAQELVFVQSEFYVMEGEGGVMVPDADNLFSMGNMNYVTFNGYANQYVEHPIKVVVGEPIRIFVVNCGPNIWSSFHVVGAIFDRVYPNANPKNEQIGMQSISIGPGDGACVEFTLDEPGTYVAVNHSFGHAAHGAIALLQAE